jgi:hypothetical protein
MLFDTTEFDRRLYHRQIRLAVHSASRVPFVDMEAAHGWLADCKYEHKPCVAAHHVFKFGNKVMDCIERKVMPAPESCTYVALSYVWGTGSHQDMLSADFADVNLLQTIEDGIEVTQQLGYRYNWVDKYLGMCQ